MRNSNADCASHKIEARKQKTMNQAATDLLCFGIIHVYRFGKAHNQKQRQNHHEDHRIE